MSTKEYNKLLVECEGMHAHDRHHTPKEKSLDVC